MFPGKARASFLETSTLALGRRKHSVVRSNRKARYSSRAGLLSEADLYMLGLMARSARPLKVVRTPATVIGVAALDVVQLAIPSHKAAAAGSAYLARSAIPIANLFPAICDIGSEQVFVSRFRPVGARVGEVRVLRPLSVYVVSFSGHGVFHSLAVAFNSSECSRKKCASTVQTATEAPMLCPLDPISAATISSISTIESFTSFGSGRCRVRQGSLSNIFSSLNLSPVAGTASARFGPSRPRPSRHCGAANLCCLSGVASGSGDDKWRCALLCPAVPLDRA
jgi:hypothetical protein